MRPNNKGQTSFFRKRGPSARHLTAFLVVMVSADGWSADVPVLAPDEEEDSVPVASPGPLVASPAQLARVGPGSDPTGDPEAVWGIPPVPWRAQFTLSSGSNRTGAGGSTRTLSKSLAAHANSFIWQPWFARVSGSARFSESDTRDGSGERSGTGAGGDIRLSFLPSSRYPLNVDYSQSNSRTEAGGAAASSSAVSRRLSLDNRYSPPDKSYSAEWSYNLNQLQTSGSSRSVMNALAGTVSVPLPGDNPQSLLVGGNWTSGRTDAGASSDFGRATATHTIYLEDYVMSINSDAFAAANRTHTSSAVSENQVLQAGSTFDWIPDDDSPLRLGGGVRGFSTRAMTSSANQSDNSNRLATLDAQLRFNYPLSRKWAFGGSLSGLGTWHHDASGQLSRIGQVAANANASWRGEGLQRKMGAWDYDMSYGSSSSVTGNYRRATGSPADSTQTLGVSGNLGHAVRRQLDVSGYRSPLRVSLGQSFSASRNSSAATHSLRHNADGVWQVDTKPGVQLNLSAGVTDVRSFGDTTSDYQSVQASLLGNVLLSGASSFASNLGVQLNRQSTGGSRGEWRGSAMGGANYTHSRFAAVPGLQYSAGYTVNVRPSLGRNLGQADEKDFQVDHQFSQGWGWRLGLLGWRLENTIQYDAIGNTSASLFLTVTRDFGGVL